MTRERICKLFNNVELSVSSYDTAWVAMVPSLNSLDSPYFPECLSWLMDNQLNDGSWGLLHHNLQFPLLKDTLSSTLASIVALRKWNVGEHHIKKEGLGNFYDWNMVMRYQMKNGSILNSPSATAAALIRHENADCLDYLTALIEKFGNAVPTIYPHDLYVRLYMVDQLERLGISRHFTVEIQIVLDEAYSSSNISNEDYIRLAEEDFNACQSIFRGEMKDLERWVVENNLDKINSRQKMAYCYFSSASILSSPELSDARITWAKGGFLNTIVDDFIDSEGSVDELENIIRCVEKYNLDPRIWNVNVDTDCCSEEVRIIFLAIKDLLSWIGEAAFKWQARDWLELLNSMLTEGKWARDRVVPTMNDYMENAYVGYTLGTFVLPALYFIGPKLSEDVVQSSEYRNLFEIMSTHGRLINDIRTFKRELKDGKLNNAVTLHKNYGKSGIDEEEIVKEIKILIDNLEKELMQLVLETKENIVPKACKDALDMRRERIRKLFSNVELSVSSYDTAWVAMVPSPNSPNSPCFPECLSWLMDNQLNDGSWGLLHHNLAFPLVKDALSSTLASIIALRKWNVGEHHIEKGLCFIESHLASATDKNEPSPFGFDIIFPHMIEHAKDLNIKFPLKQKDLSLMLHERELELRSSLNISNEDYIRLADEDFNACQSIFHVELKDLERWVVANNLDKIKSRQKMAYCYFSGASVLSSPELSDARITWAKGAFLVTISDDFFDVDGSVEELENLIQCVEKIWNVNADTDCCSKEVRIIFLALKDVVSWIGDKAFKWQGRDVTSHVVQCWLELMHSMLTEAKWARDGVVPTMNGYIENGYVSFTLGVFILPALYFIGPKLSEDIVQSSEYHNLFKLMSTHGRLINDIRTFKRELKDGKLNAVTLHKNYGKNGIEEEEIVSEIKILIDNLEKRLMQLVLETKEVMVPKACKDVFWKMLCVDNFFYATDDGFTGDDILHTMKKVFYEPVSMLK
ncbi:hypothetical protein SSX86_006895 [Deinandra increscens subsp. villosa]|uniref:Ent-kaurene synthase n=1 Tax=Deinandra increscens subsp. villosa TaxID=3103831 RepID=A0AAP0DJT6_9ASTR